MTTRPRIPQTDDEETLELITTESSATGVDFFNFTDFPYPDEGHPYLGPTDQEEVINRTQPRKDSIYGDVVLKRLASGNRRPMTITA